MQQEKILVIDDEEDYCLIMRVYFLRFNYDVQLAYTLKEGLRLVEEFQPDILFLDNNLPDGQGWNHVHTIREKLKDVQINLISAFRPTVEHITNFNDLKFWEKPISFDELQAAFDKR